MRCEIRSLLYIYGTTVDVIGTAVQPRALSTMAARASNKRSRKAKHSGKENFDVATDGDDMDDFLPPKTRFGALDSDF